MPSAGDVVWKRPMQSLPSWSDGLMGSVRRCINTSEGIFVGGFVCVCVWGMCLGSERENCGESEKGGTCGVGSCRGSLTLAISEGCKVTQGMGSIGA